MGQKQSRVENPNANVVNRIEIEPQTMSLNIIEICVILITIIITLNFLLHVYATHNKRLKKKYTSRVNDLEKI